MDGTYLLYQLSAVLAQKEFIIASLQHEVTSLRSMVELSHTSLLQPCVLAMPKQAQAVCEPHATNTKTGAAWARMAQGIWHADEARLRVELAGKQQAHLRSDALGSILECLQGLDENFVATMRTLLEEFEGKNLVEFCNALEHFARARLRI